jgi:hypothetical protein
LKQRSLFGLGFWLLLGDDYGGGYFVLGFEVEELDAVGAARMDLVSVWMILPNWLMTISSPVSSTRLMPGTFPILRAAFKTEFPKWESQKINPVKVACFSRPKTDRQLTNFSPAIHHNFTTKIHIQPPVFAKTSPRNGPHYLAKNLEIEDLGVHLG